MQAALLVSELPSPGSPFLLTACRRLLPYLLRASCAPEGPCGNTVTRGLQWGSCLRSLLLHEVTHRFWGGCSLFGAVSPAQPSVRAMTTDPALVSRWSGRGASQSRRSSGGRLWGRGGASTLRAQGQTFGLRMLLCAVLPGDAIPYCSPVSSYQRSQSSRRTLSCPARPAGSLASPPAAPENSPALRCLTSRPRGF